MIFLWIRFSVVAVPLYSHHPVPRGTLTSQLSNAYILNFEGGAPQRFAIQFTFDLSNGKARGTWTNPVTGKAETVSVTLTFLKRAIAPEGKYYIFYGDKSSDKAGYTFTFIPF